MPVHYNPDGSMKEFAPTAEDYYRYFPEMKTKVGPDAVTAVIGGKFGAGADWTRNLDPSNPEHKRRIVIEHKERKAISPIIAKASYVLNEEFLRFCSNELESLEPDVMEQAFCELLHSVVCKVYLGIDYKRSMVMKS